MTGNQSGVYKVPFKKRLKDSRTCYVLMAPYMIFFMMFLVIPIFIALYISLTYFDMLQPPKFVGLLNYERMFFEDKIFMKVLKNTLFFALITGPLSYVFCFLFAWLLNELSPKLRSVMTLIFYVPSLAPSMYIIWSYIFSGDSYGVVNGILSSLAIIHAPIQWLSDSNYMMTVLIIVQLWSCLSTSFLAFIAGFQSLNKDLYEAGAIDGIRNRWQELFKITLPQLAPQLLFAAVMQISAAFTSFTVIVGLAGSPTTQYSADTLVTYMLDVTSTKFELGYSSAIAVFLLVLMLATNQVVTSLLRRYRTD